MSAVRAAVEQRQSCSKVTDVAPTDAELATLIAAAGRVADHSALRPWRIITIRGTDRERLGRALNRATGEKGASSKPMRAPLLVAVVFTRRPSGKVPSWEQEAVASGVAHMLSLLLDDAGWGVLWRTGEHVRSKPVAELHGLAPNEQLMGWLYVGGKPDRKPGRRVAIDLTERVSALPVRKNADGTTTGAPSRVVTGPIVAPHPVNADEIALKRARKAEKKVAKKAAAAEKKAIRAQMTPAEKLREKAEKSRRSAEKAARRAEKDDARASAAEATAAP